MQTVNIAVVRTQMYKEGSFASHQASQWTAVSRTIFRTSALILTYIVSSFALVLSGFLHIQHHATLPHSLWGFFLVIFGLTTLLFGNVRPIWHASCLLFSGLTLASIYKLGIGDNNCNCFPGITIPAYCALTLDITILISLLLMGPAEKRTRHHLPKTIFLSFLLLLCIIPLGYHVNSRSTANWPPPFNKGKWHVIVIQPGCGHCESASEALIPSVNNNPSQWGIVAESDCSIWLAKLGLSSAVPIATRPIPNKPTPFIIVLNDGILIDITPIPYFDNKDQ